MKATGGMMAVSLRIAQTGELSDVWEKWDRRSLIIQAATTLYREKQHIADASVKSIRNRGPAHTLGELCRVLVVQLTLPAGCLCVNPRV